MPHLPRTLALAVLAAAPLTALAQQAAAQQAPAEQAPGQVSPEQGEEIARRWCAGCHLVAPDQLLASTEAPAFAAIAAESEGDFGWLAPFLADPHPAMPRLSLSRQQIRDLGAYLAGLRE